MYDVFVPCGFHCILLVIPFCDSYTVINYLPFHCCRICYIISSQLYHASYEDAVLCLFCFSPLSSITLCPHFSLLHSSNFFHLCEACIWVKEDVCFSRNKLYLSRLIWRHLYIWSVDDRHIFTITKIHPEFQDEILSDPIRHVMV